MMNRTAIIAVFCYAAWALTGAALAQNYPFPLVDGLTHTGVASCSTAGCHGDQVAGDGAGSVVGQNEYFRWRAPDEAGAHSRAYEVLLTAHAKRIARNLGIGAPEKSSQCLDCHADNIAPEFRSTRFQISDGVGCEACHGGAQDWLAFHRIGAGHDKNIEAGLFPTEDADARAGLCLNCHLGSSTKNQFVSHRIMGAGHPRLKFELDLYTAVQQHHRADAGYAARKDIPQGSQIWAIGQARALQRTLDLLVDQRTGRSGAFPELVFFDCHACHQPISAGASDLAWRPNPARALGPGVPVLNDANMIMLIAAARIIDPELGTQLESDGKVLHAASQHSTGNFHNAAATVRDTAGELATRILSTDFSDKAMVRAILLEVVNRSLADRYTNYAAAEQALFAVQRLTADLNLNGPAMTDAIAEASRHVQGPYSYNQGGFRRALGEIEGILAR